MDLSSLLNPDPSELRAGYARHNSYSESTHRRESWSSLSLSPDAERSFSASPVLYNTPPCSEPTDSPIRTIYLTFEPYQAHPAELPNTPPVETRSLASYSTDQHDVLEQTAIQSQECTEPQRGIILPLVGMMNLDINVNFRPYPIEKSGNRLVTLHGSSRIRPGYHRQLTRRATSHRGNSCSHCGKRLTTSTNNTDICLNDRCPLKRKDVHGPKPKSRRAPPAEDTSHSNKKYTWEHVHYIRYNKEDLKESFGDIRAAFYALWPQENRLSDQCFSSRYYRDNLIPILRRGGWDLAFDKEGRVLMKKAPVRKRETEEFRTIPFKLVEMMPWMALKYDWVRPEDKSKAEMILEQDRRDEMRGRLSEPGKWRRVILEATKYKMKPPV